MSRMRSYMTWLRDRGVVDCSSYEELHAWSTSNIAEFWQSMWDYLPVQAHAPHTSVLADARMPGASWFPGARLNYAEHALAASPDRVALVAATEDSERVAMTYGELRDKVSLVAAWLRKRGVGPGDRVAAYLPNTPETVVTFLATASVGAIWSSCGPEFGAPSVLDRIGQIRPKVLVAVDGYHFNGRPVDRVSEVSAIRDALPSVEATLLVRQLDAGAVLDDVEFWDDVVAGEARLLVFEPVPFDHPLWIVFSSGTTGRPKALVHGHGGVLLEHFKSHALHLDLGSDDVFLWYTSTGWVMWNLLVGGLLLGATVVLYDGSATYPDESMLWRLADDCGATVFGVSAALVHATMKTKFDPRRELALQGLRTVGCTGSPLSPEGFAWIYDHVKPDVLLGSMSGGTDVASAFVGPCPLLPVRAGEIQCRLLGVAAHAYDDDAESVIGEVGELVVTEPMPSMPLYFWDDPGNERLLDTYYSTFSGVWRHGDWIKFTPHGSCVIYGRSDATLNRGGVRMGTAEFYRVIENIEQVAESLVVDVGMLGREGELLCFIVPTDAGLADDALIAEIRKKLRTDLSPRHVPDAIHFVADIPRTVSGKKLEVPLRQLFLGRDLDEIVNPESVANPEAFEEFVRLARSVSGADKSV